MSENEGIEAAVIEKLLATRQQLTAWLLKLDEAGKDVAGAVRERVKADYEGRLAEVVFELRGHSTVLTGSVETLKVQLSEHNRIRMEEQETLAEAELRYRVGEFSEKEWSELQETSKARLGAAERQIEELSLEIGQFEEVLNQIDQDDESSEASGAPSMVQPEAEDTAAAMEATSEMGGAEPEPEQAAAMESEGSAGPVGEEDEADILALKPNMVEGVKLSEPVEAPKFTPKGGGDAARDSGGHRTIRFPAAKPGGDDLAFLKSMSVGPGKRSGSAARTGERAAAGTTANATKTLKCGDCGAMNRPTEWYCERCGAELAAL